MGYLNYAYYLYEMKNGKKAEKKWSQLTGQTIRGRNSCTENEINTWALNMTNYTSTCTSLY